MLYLWVGVAGAAGAFFRYILGWAVGFWWIGLFPLSTFMANVLGAFIFGFLTSYISRNSSIPQVYLSIAGTGFVGAFTTFSTFSLETVSLLQCGHVGVAVFYVLLSMGTGLASSAFGYWLGGRMP